MTRLTKNWLIQVLIGLWSLTIVGCTFDPGIEYIEIRDDAGPVGELEAAEVPTGVVRRIPLPEAPRTYIFILGGQSNMSGRGLISSLPKGYPFHGHQILNFTNAYGLVPATEPIDSNIGQVDRISIEGGEPGVGPGLVFADSIAASLSEDDTIVLVPCAKGGSTTQDWAFSYFRNSLFGSCIDRALRARALTGGDFAALLWYQGESDSVSPETAEGWASRTQAIWDNFRQSLGESGLPILYVRLPESFPAIYTGWRTTQAEQSFLMSVERRQIWIQAPSLINPDQIHLSTAGHLILGQQMATVWLSLR